MSKSTYHEELMQRLRRISPADSIYLAIQTYAAIYKEKPVYGQISPEFYRCFDPCDWPPRIAGIQFQVSPVVWFVDNRKTGKPERYLGYLLLTDETGTNIYAI